MSACSRPGAGQDPPLGITAHRLQVALDAVDSGLYETIQFPFSYLSSGQGAGAGAPQPGEKHGFPGHEGLA